MLPLSPGIGGEGGVRGRSECWYEEGPQDTNLLDDQEGGNEDGTGNVEDVGCNTWV